MPECPECGRHVGVLLEDGWCIWCDQEHDRHPAICPVCGHEHYERGELCPRCRQDLSDAVDAWHWQP